MVTSECCQLSLQGQRILQERAKAKDKQKNVSGDLVNFPEAFSYQKVLVINAKPLSEVSKHQRAVLLELEMTGHVLPVHEKTQNIASELLKNLEIPYIFTAKLTC